jgi:cytochrome c heme-lyase
MPPPLPQGYKLPFDRHDWVVDRCGREVRYVIDFYAGAPAPGAQASMHLDVRPALDSFGAVVDRLRMQWSFVASGKWREP